jgi:hypothetical protein
MKSKWQMALSIDRRKTRMYSKILNLYSKRIIKTFSIQNIRKYVKIALPNGKNHAILLVTSYC